MNHAIKNNSVIGINSTSSSNKKSTKVFKSPPCESCILAKGHRISASRTPGSTHSRTTKAGLKLTIQSITSTLESSPISSNAFIPTNNQPTNVTSNPTSTSFDTSSQSSPQSNLCHLKFPPLYKLAVDIKGPINASHNSASAKKYVLIFTCMSTRYRFAAFLKSKDEAVIYTGKLITYLRAINSPVQEIEQLVKEETDDSFLTSQ